MEVERADREAHQRYQQVDAATSIPLTKAQQWAKTMQTATASAALADQTCSELSRARPTFKAPDTREPAVAPIAVLKVGDEGNLILHSHRLAEEDIPAMRAWLDEWFSTR